MSQRLNIYCILGVIVIIVINGLSVTTIRAQNKQEVVVTIEGFTPQEKLVHFYKGEELRNQMKFAEAIEEYNYVIGPGELCGKEAEAHYDIGICYTWLGKKDTAEAVFQEVMNTYPDSNEVIAFSRYGLSWIDVQRGKFQDAIGRLQQTLQQTLDENIYPEKEFCARAQFQIGRIYLVFLHDYERAEQAFRKVMEKYPDSEIINHPFLEKLKGK